MKGYINPGFCDKCDIPSCPLTTTIVCFQQFSDTSVCIFAVLLVLSTLGLPFGLDNLEESCKLCKLSFETLRDLTWTQYFLDFVAFLYLIFILRHFVAVSHLQVHFY